jgi:hypothetical protein
MRVRPYTAEDEDRWDRLCEQSAAASFLHHRRFLSHHGDRFIDRSLVLVDGDRWLGVLPAALSPSDSRVVESHPGLTYGGFVHDGALRGERAIEALQLVIEHYSNLGFERLRYKPLPLIYHRSPAQDDLYALFRAGAQRTRCNLASCIDLAHPPGLNERRRRGLAKANKAGLHYDSGIEHAPALWLVLEQNLLDKYGSNPTHNVEQILDLAQRFPENIIFEVAMDGADVVAGCVVFVVGPVRHLQYIASSEAGQAQSALDGLFNALIQRARADGARYFDFGTSNEEHGRVLIESLYRFKSEFGGGGVAYECYELGLATCP